MITGVHTMFYTSDPEGARAFLRDKLGLPFFEVGDGWLIFNLPPAEMGCHPVQKGSGLVPSGHQEISFFCDDIQKTVADLKVKGVEFIGPIANLEYGRVTHFKMPGDFTVQLYQPAYR